MVNRFGTARLYDDSPAAATPQEQVNLQMLKAVELLGRRLERAESERDQMARRLAEIEAAATIDEKTGKLYLPVVVDRGAPPQNAAIPRWTVGVSLMSSALALVALGLAFYREPQALPLTPRQVAALNALAEPARFAGAEAGAWKKVDETEGLDAKPASAGDNPAVASDAPAPAAQSASTAVQEIAQKEPAALPLHQWADVFGPPAPVVAAASPVKPALEIHKSGIPAPVEQVNLPPLPSRPEKAVVDAKGITEKAEKPQIATAPKEDNPSATDENIQAKPSEEKDVAVQISPDPALSPKLADLEKRAFSGSPEAQHDLATIYAAGKSVGQDYKRAVYWFYKAADGGIANADYNLGVMFQQGMGLRKDVNKALGWYEKAAQLGHPEAMYNLGIAYVEGVGTPRNIERGVSYFKKAANAGVAQAAYNLGVLYESNFVGSIDLAKAVEWYQVAADEGHASAKDAVTRLRQQIAVAAKTGDQGAKVAAAVEPASGAASDEEYGEGDASPVNEGKRLPSDLLVQVQAALISHGDLSGKATGVLDEKTTNAIRGWQKRLGLPVSGQPSRDLLDGLRDAMAK